jgi:hypothetical protein
MLSPELTDQIIRLPATDRMALMELISRSLKAQIGPGFHSASGSPWGFAGGDDRRVANGAVGVCLGRDFQGAGDFGPRSQEAVQI